MITDVVYENFSDLKTTIVQSEKIPKWVDNAYNHGYSIKQLRCVGV